MGTLKELKMLQALPLDIKIAKTKLRIREWYEYWGGNVYVSFSGGKDSTVLLDIARKEYPDIKAVFVDTGLEYPSIRKFAQSKENVTILRPQMKFREVITKYGYPIPNKRVARVIYYYRKGSEWAIDILNGLSHRTKEPNGYMADRYGKWKFLTGAPFNISDRCCEVMKEKPLNTMKGKAISALLAEESTRRLNAWIKTGCNSFDTGMSKPMSFWKENDVLEYLTIYHDEMLQAIKERMREIGCEEEQIREIKHPWADCYGEIIVEDKEQIKGQVNIHDCLNDYRGCKFCTTGCKRTGCIFCLFGITQDPKRILGVQKQEPKIADFVLRGGEFNENGLWQPSKNGLGFWFVIKWLEVHGNLYIPFNDYEMYEEKYGNEQTIELLKQQEG